MTGRAANGVNVIEPRRPTPGWAARPLLAWSVRALVLLAPLVASFAFVRFASAWLKPPTSSLALYLAWWFGLSGGATVVLFAVSRLTRRLLPLAALLKLSLIFPDETPSRMQTALRAGSVDTLEKRLALVRKAKAATTPREAAAVLLELISALDVHDRLTRGHSERVRAYAVLIGKELGLRKDELELLNWAALLHDIGKLEVEQGILTKTGRPSAEEWQVLRRHPLFGEQLTEPLRDWLAGWQAAVGHHHERWDGKGYPRNLKGEEIPLPGRIVAVADVFDVITSARSYKEAGNSVDGRQEIARCAGSQFDPRVVRAFLNVSLGRMRVIMGPLSWLSHIPSLGRMPLTSTVGTFAGTLSVFATATASGALAHQAPSPAKTTSTAAVARPHDSSPPPPVPTMHRRRTPTGLAARAHISAAGPFVLTPPHVPAPTAPATPAPLSPVAETPPPAITSAEPAPSTPEAVPAKPTPTPTPRPPPPPTTTTPHSPLPAPPAPIPAPPAAPPHLAFTTEPGGLAAGTTTQIQVTVQDKANQPVTGDNSTAITLSLIENPAGGTLACTNPGGTGPVVVQGGVATFTCGLERAGSGYMLGADDTTGASPHPYPAARSDTFAVTSGAPAQLLFTGQPTGTTAGSSIAPAVRVTLEDAYGNTVDADNTTNVTLALGANPGTSTLGGTLTRTVSAGVATFADLTVDDVATGYTLTATSSPAHPPVDSDPFDIAPGPAAQLVFSGEPTDTAPGDTLTPAVEVTIEDAAGNVVAADNSTTVTLALGSNPGASTLGGTLTQTVNGGVATFGDLTLDNPGTAYTLAATSNPTLAGATSNPFDVTVAGLVGETLLTTNRAHPCTSGSSCTTASFAATPGATLLVVVQRAGSTTASDGISGIIGPVLAPVAAAAVEYPTPTQRDYLFAWTATAVGLPGSLTVQFAPGSNANPTIVEVLQLSGVNPLVPIAQAPTNTGTSGNASATLASADPANGEVLLVAFRKDKPLTPPLGFGTVDAYRSGSDGGDSYGVFFSPSARAATTILTPAGGGNGGWGTIALELNHS